MALSLASSSRIAPAPQQRATPAVIPSLESASLYVGELDVSVVEEQLFWVFSTIAPVASVKICRDRLSRVSLGYGYVNFYTQQAAYRAIEELNYTMLNNKSIRVMFSQRDPTMRKSGNANIFVKNLHLDIDNKLLFTIFSNFGKVISCKVATNTAGQSKGYGFVQFDINESAEKAIASLNGMLMNDYDLKKEFGIYGEITSAVVMREENGDSKFFGFVNFEKAEAAAAAVEGLNGKAFGEKVLYVQRAQKRADREAELRAIFELRRSRLDRWREKNLYVKNLEESIGDAELKEMFSVFGEVLSCKVMLDGEGRSKGFGFVAFTTQQSAICAINEMHRKVIGRKQIYVAFAQRKEERTAMLMAHFSQFNTVRSMRPAMQSYWPVHQQLYYGQAGWLGLIPTPPTVQAVVHNSQMRPQLRATASHASLAAGE
ncbi:Polyadenylate-binding protein [Rhynchospora pubera]|uniref:Polyadenylate-binding protein n=1 Tax=Rhynchospora pubera TaxID=906938 RepID=A0AAV8DRR1_9POAL|nr:Polyadenylate-binding protein [Rhynchospora pubera]KAJ4782256.1 Polyadenylate-binding protein [Rhynchospora pubera]